MVSMLRSVISPSPPPPPGPVSAAGVPTTGPGDGAAASDITDPETFGLSVVSEMPVGFPGGPLPVKYERV